MMNNRINKTAPILFVCVVIAFSLGLKRPVHSTDFTAQVSKIFALNSYGLPTAQYLPGGDLRLSENDFRFGFSIFRLF